MAEGPGEEAVEGAGVGGQDSELDEALAGPTCSTNVSLPLSNWTVAGTPVSNAPGLMQFTDPKATNPQQFYLIRSP